MRNLFRVFSLAVFMLVLASASAWAAPIISSTIVNYSTSPNQITINGTNLVYGATYRIAFPTKVVLNGTLLSIVGTPTTTAVTAQLPGGLAAGTYVIKVQNASGASPNFDVAYGAAGVDDVAALTASLNAETTRAEGAEATLTNNLNNLSLTAAFQTTNLNTETTRAEAAEGTLTTNLAAEINRANGAEDCLKSKVDALQVAVNGPAMQAALMQWYPSTYTAGSRPETLAFDGTNVWIANYGDGTVTVLNAATGKPATLSGNSNPISVGSPLGPFGIAFDGTNMWVANWTDNTVSEINVGTGTIVKTITVGTNPDCVAFDGTNIWVGNYTDGTVSEIDASTGTLVQTITVGNAPYCIGFDGLNMWVADSGDNKVYEINGAGAVLNTFTAAGVTQARDVVFDGANIWIGSRYGSTVTKIPAR